MGPAASNFVFTQLAYQIPILLVYLAAFFLALMFLNRAPTPAILTLSGVVVLVATMVGMPLIQSAIMELRNNGGLPDNILVTIVGIAGSCLRAVGLGLLIAAIFTGCRSATPGSPPSSPGAF